MKVEIYGDVKGTPQSHKIWQGDLSILPRPDDAICINEYDAALYVRSVVIVAATNSAIINVWMAKGDYPAIT